VNGTDTHPWVILPLTVIQSRSLCWRLFTDHGFRVAKMYIGFPDAILTEQGSVFQYEDWKKRALEQGYISDQLGLSHTTLLELESDSINLCAGYTIRYIQSTME
jgi:hypothetical protein